MIICGNDYDYGGFNHHSNHCRHQIHHHQHHHHHHHLLPVMLKAATEEPLQLPPLRSRALFTQPGRSTQATHLPEPDSWKFTTASYISWP